MMDGEEGGVEVPTTYDGNAVIVDVCFLVQFVLQFGVLNLGHDTAGVQT